MEADNASARKASKSASKPRASSQGKEAKQPKGPMPNPFETAEDKPAKRTGRPSKFTQETAAKVLELLASGKPMTPTVLKKNGLPAPQTIYRWTEENESFRDEYTRARMFQAHVYADQTLEIADTAEDAGLAKLQIDARKWYASKVIPKLYGDRQDIEVNHTVKIAEEHAAALIELSRRKREADTKIIDITPDASLNKGMHSESKQHVIELLPKIGTGSEDDAG